MARPIHAIEHDQIVEEWVVWDKLSLLARLHVPPLAPHIDVGETAHASSANIRVVDE